jgi:hypothetical protein
LYSVTAGAGDSAIGASRHIAGFWAKADADAQSRRKATQAARSVFTLNEECPRALQALQSHEDGIRELAVDPVQHARPILAPERAVPLLRQK